ncbi:MAG TPA: hypothetical protein VNA89_10945 [Gemmatimonadaceae bacterium]|nr:hypothetical protein [Gemmatimonadaceae bacterium]
MGALIDDYLPTYDVRERHRTRVRASARATYAALQATDLAPPGVRLLLALRALPSALAGGGGLAALRARGREPLTLRGIERAGFRLLAERAPEEIVLGVEGRFWRMSGGRSSPAAEGFRDARQPPGTARAVWSFTVRELGEGLTELATETRVRCADAGARRRFLPYWALIRPGSGLIRRLMLRAIRRTAERTAAAAVP